MHNYVLSKESPTGDVQVLFVHGFGTCPDEEEMNA